MKSGIKLRSLPRKAIGVLAYFRKKEKTLDSYYVFPENCQISNLSYIYEFFFGKINGVLVEVGAYDGISWSNSSGLIERGWHGFLIEPVPFFGQKLQSHYRGRDNVTYLPVAISDTDREIQINVAGPFTTANLDLLNEYKSTNWAKSSVSGSSSISVEAMTLDHLMNNIVHVHVDVLVVDVEGYEDKVFSTFDRIVSKPSMIIVELSELHPDLKTSVRSSVDLRNKLESMNYRIVFKDATNTIFIDSKLYSRFLAD